MSNEHASPKSGVKSWREASRTERVAGWVFFGSIWVLSLVMRGDSEAELVGVIAWGLALAVGAPLAFSDSDVVWRIFRWPTRVLVVIGVVLLFVVPAF